MSEVIKGVEYDFNHLERHEALLVSEQKVINVVFGILKVITGSKWPDPGGRAVKGVEYDSHTPEHSGALHGDEPGGSQSRLCRLEGKFGF